MATLDQAHLQECFVGLREKIEQLESALGQAQPEGKKDNGLTEAMLERHGFVEALKKERDVLQEKVTDLNKTIEVHQGRLFAIEKRYKEKLQARQTLLEGQIALYREKENENQKLEVSIAALQEEHRVAHMEKEKENQKLKARIAELEEEHRNVLTRKNDKITTLRAQAAENTETLRKVRSVKEAFKKKMHDMASDFPRNLDESVVMEKARYVATSRLMERRHRDIASGVRALLSRETGPFPFRHKCAWESGKATIIIPIRLEVREADVNAVLEYHATLWQVETESERMEWYEEWKRIEDMEDAEPLFWVHHGEQLSIEGNFDAAVPTVPVQTHTTSRASMADHNNRQHSDQSNNAPYIPLTAAEHAGRRSRRGLKKFSRSVMKRYNNG
jgi:hypothetical protein